MGGLSKVEVVGSKGCSKLFVGFQSSVPSLRGLHSFDQMSHACSSLASELVAAPSTGPFSGLVICVTGLSKEARKQVKEATERLGGQYSPSLHPQCTHLVVQSFTGPKFEHALKHGSKYGLFVVTLGWFVDSVKRHVRLSESLYAVKNVGDNGAHAETFSRIVELSGAENSCLPTGLPQANQFDLIGNRHQQSSESNKNTDSILSGHIMYIDSDISDALRSKVLQAATKEGAKIVDRWFVGCSASFVVCEGSSAHHYIGHSKNIVTPLWVLKTAKEKHMQRLVQMSADLARQIGMMIEKSPTSTTAGKEDIKRNVLQDTHTLRDYASHDQRQKIVTDAKIRVRNRRGRRMQTCQTPIRPITPSNLLDSICWSISEPTSAASIYTDSLSVDEDSERMSIFFDAKGEGKEDSEASFANLTRSLTESEKNELVFKNHFITILYPVDRFSEMGPSSRSYFSDIGFTCLQMLDHIYAFYQENMSLHEIEGAIHTDSKNADKLRAVYSSKESAEQGYTNFKRIDFLGSRKSFEMLKRVNGDNNSNVYELLLRA